MVIQNLACIEITLTPESHRQYFVDGIYRGQKVTGVFFYQGNGQSASPLYKDKTKLLELPDNLHFYLSVTDTAGKLRISNFVSDYHIKNFADAQRPGFIPFNFIINPDLSYIEYSVTETIHLLMCIAYETEKPECISRQHINGAKTFSVTFELQPDGTYIIDKKLSDIVGNFLLDKKIKDIRVYGTDSAFYNIYAWLVTDKFFIENLFIQSGAPLPKEEMMLQNLRIDAEKSLIKMRYMGGLFSDPFGDNSINIDLTFYY
jgi:hypothetical protein